MLNPLPIGISDFRELIENNYQYMDKSLLIQEIIDAPAKILLLTRPRRFGKTLNLSMLRYFFEQPPPDNQETPAGNLFAGLAISQIPACLKHLGRHPVIFLTFKDIKQHSFGDCFEQIQATLAEEFQRHRFLLEQQLNEEETDAFKSILKMKATLTETERALKLLTRLLHRATGQKVVLLIDEYDTPIHAAHTYNYLDRAVVFIRNLLSAALKDNPLLEKGVLTGILRVARESIFSGLNNLSVHTVLQPEFSDQFGFTETQTEQLLREAKCDDSLADVRKWYNGYRFGETTVYNPWSILKFIADRERRLQPHWINTSSNDLVRDLIVRGDANLHAALEQLFAGNSIVSPLDEFVSLRDTAKNSEAVFSLLLHSGYLKIVSRRDVPDGKALYELTVPNVEVRIFYEDVIRLWLSQSVGAHNLQRMLTALLDCDMESFGDYLQELTLGVLSFHDLPQRKSEQVHHAFMLGLLVSLSDRYRVVSNRESGYGRYDALLIPKDSREKGFVFEFKEFRAAKDGDPEKALLKAFDQIRGKDYAAELRAEGVESAFGVGVVFDGKQVFVRGEVL